MKHKEQRVLVLFDVQNMYYSAKHLYNRKVNFKAILAEAVSNRRLVRAISYVIRADIKEETNFHDALNKIGIEVKSKDLQIFHGGNKKGDWDIGIAMDAVRMVHKIDTLVIVSGDGDFKDLLEYMKSHGCRTEVIAIGNTASKQLKESADLFFDIEKNTKKFFIGSAGPGGPRNHPNTNHNHNKNPNNRNRTPKHNHKPAIQNNKNTGQNNKPQALPIQNTSKGSKSSFVMPEIKNGSKGNVDSKITKPINVEKKADAQNENKKISVAGDNIKLKKKVVKKKTTKKKVVKKAVAKTTTKSTEKKDKDSTTEKKGGFASKLKKFISKD